MQLNLESPHFFVLVIKLFRNNMRRTGILSFLAKDNLSSPAYGIVHSNLDSVSAQCKVAASGAGWSSQAQGLLEVRGGVPRQEFATAPG